VALLTSTADVERRILALTSPHPSIPAACEPKTYTAMLSHSTRLSFFSRSSCMVPGCDGNPAHHVCTGVAAEHYRRNREELPECQLGGGGLGEPARLQLFTVDANGNPLVLAPRYPDRQTSPKRSWNVGCPRTDIIGLRSNDRFVRWSLRTRYV